MTIVVGIGLILFASAIIVLQLRFFREGDRVHHGARRARMGSGTAPTAPCQLKNPIFRAIWINMEETQWIMRQKEEQARSEELRREKERLGLTEEEAILFMGARSWLCAWPVALASLACLLSSVTMFGRDSTLSSFLCLAIGLVGLLFLTAVNGQTRYYLTSFRVLVGRKTFPCGAARWSVMHYTDVRRCSVRQNLIRSSLTLEGGKEPLGIVGLARSHLNTVMGILRKELPAAACLPRERARKEPR